MWTCKQCNGFFCKIGEGLLGDNSISPRKTECGNPLVILGVLATASKEGATFVPSPDKVNKWLITINRGLEERVCSLKVAMGHPANVPQSRQDDDKAHHGPDLQ